MTEARWLVDSTICIYHLLGVSDILYQRLRAHRGQIVTSAVCYGEVMLGIARSGKGDPVGAHQLFGELTVLPFDRAAADSYALVPFRRASFDRLIAAHALALGAVLVTNNPADFADIPNLSVDNWLA